MNARQSTSSDHSGLSPWLAVALVFVPTAAFVLLFWAVGLLDGRHDESAVLGLIGVMATATITAIGVMLRHSVDAHTVAIAERTVAATEEGEVRLRNESSIKALALLDGSADRLDAVLLSLATVGHLRLALALLDGKWRARTVSVEVASFVVDEALRRGVDQDRTSAIAMLVENATSTLPHASRTHNIPHSINGWRIASSNIDVRQGAIRYLAHLARHASVDSGRRPSDARLGDVGPVMVPLYYAVKRDTDPRTRSEARLLLATLLDTCQSLASLHSLQGELGESISFSELRDLARDSSLDASDRSVTVDTTVTDITDWGKVGAEGA